MTDASDFVLANLSAVVLLMKPKPYESSSIPTNTPPAPVHRDGFTASQLIVIEHSSALRHSSKNVRSWRGKAEQYCSPAQPNPLPERPPPASPPDGASFEGGRAFQGLCRAAASATASSRSEPSSTAP